MIDVFTDTTIALLNLIKLKNLDFDLWIVTFKNPFLLRLKVYVL